MKKLLLIFCSLIFIQSQAQFSIKSGDEDIIKNRKVATPKKVKTEALGGTTISSNLKTKNSTNKSNAALFNLYVLREETKIILNLTLEKGEMPAIIIVQRKTSSDISEYATIKEFTDEDLAILNEDKKIIFEDAFPETRKLDTYYRIIYEYGNGAKKITSGVLLEGQTGIKEGIYGDHEKDEALFVDEREEAEDQGVAVIAERIKGKVTLTIQNNGILQASQDVNIERKTNDNISTFRSIKQLNEEELNTLISAGELIVNDKYPPSFKSKTLYRVVVSSDNEKLYEFPEVELINL